MGKINIVDHIFFKYIGIYFVPYIIRNKLESIILKFIFFKKRGKNNIFLQKALAGISQGKLVAPKLSGSI